MSAKTGSASKFETACENFGATYEKKCFAKFCGVKPEGNM
jgi:hypothetical protein